MAVNNKPSEIGELWTLLLERLAASKYRRAYETESDFEADVWENVRNTATDLGLDAAQTCLTSHTVRSGRSSAAWSEFCLEEAGPDVDVLGSANRLDIVFRHPRLGSIGIEVKCLGRRGHVGKLTQGLGQAVLGLENRDRTLLVIHCGSVSTTERDHLREVSRKICAGMAAKIIVVP